LEMVEANSEIRSLKMSNLERHRSKIRRLKMRRLKLRRLKTGRVEMKTNISRRFSQGVTSIVILLALLATTVVPTLGQTRRRPRLRRYSRPKVVRTTSPAPAIVYYNVDAGQVIRVRLNETITSETARVGDQFTTTVVDPVYASGIEVIPAGSIITGRVTSVNRASRKSKPGTIGVHFVSLRLPNGIARAINGELTDITATNISADNEGQVSGRSAVKRNVVFIGGGAATGAVIGAIAGGGKGAGIGAIIGGGLGAAGAVLSKGHEAVVNSGTEFGVVLNQTLSLPAANVP
jgi:hypothetical protein